MTALSASPCCRLVRAALLFSAIAACRDDGNAATDAGEDAGTRDSGTDAARVDAARPAGGVAAGREPDGGVYWYVRDIVEHCRRLCSDSTMLRSCAAQCIRIETGLAMSEPCADCFGGVAECTVETGCADPCDISWRVPECIDCRCGFGPSTRNCGQEFRECAGVGEYCSVLDVEGPEACLNEADMSAIARRYYLDGGTPDGG